MVHVVKSYVFNAHASSKRNQHVFHLTKANLGVCLRDSNELEPDFKFACIKELDLIVDSFDLDCVSFNQLLLDKLMFIKLSVLKEIQRDNSVVHLIDALIKHFHL